MTHPVGDAKATEGNPPRYCQFAKRFLDGFSWLAPLTNNRLGDALNIEFVHEHLFLIQGDRILKNIGFNEKGSRFSEEEFGRQIETLEDMEMNGYWLVGRRYHPEAARRALEEQEDGAYYSFFSNQCQDWADRLRRRIDRIEKEEAMPPLSPAVPEEKERFWKEKPPTVPASAALGVVSLLLGIGAVLSPVLAGQKSLIVLGVFLVVSGLSDIIFAIRGQLWSRFLSILFFAALNLVAGAVMILERTYAVWWVGALLIAALAVNGLSRVVVALRSRPFRQWIGSLLAGLGFIACAILLAGKLADGDGALFGLIVGFNLIVAGLTTIQMHWSRAGGRSSKA
jgi:uncharacterized membrane protein HdeD (DUF308 family)